MIASLDKKELTQMKTKKVSMGNKRKAKTDWNLYIQILFFSINTR